MDTVDPQIALGNQLKHLTKERLEILQYLQSIFSGNGMYFGCVHITLLELNRLFGRMTSNHLFILGISIGKLTRIQSSLEFVKALDALLQEFEIHCQDTGTITKSAVSKVFSRLGRTSSFDSAGLLEVSLIPSFPLDFINVFSVLINTLLVAYHMLAPETRFTSETYFEVATHVDMKIWKLVLLPVMRELDLVGERNRQLRQRAAKPVAPVLDVKLKAKRAVLGDVSNPKVAKAKVIPKRAVVTRKTRSSDEPKADPVVEEKKTRKTRNSLAAVEVKPVLKQKKNSRTEEVKRTTKKSRTIAHDDLDVDDLDDPMMVSEYVEDIFEYLRELEIETLPNPDYMENQKELQWKMRGILVDWLVEVHTKFRLLPETLYLAVNIIDRFLSKRVVSLPKLQLVGVTALFIASKYEEVISPSIASFLYMAEDGYTEEEIVKAERYVLQVLEFNMQYPTPMSFLRRSSKADEYDIQARTLAKYLMEITLLDHQFLAVPASAVAASGHYLARHMLDRGEWNANLIHYSGYTEGELAKPVQLLLEFLSKPVKFEALFKKYSQRKFMKGAIFVKEWVGTNSHLGLHPQKDHIMNIEARRSHGKYVDNLALQLDGDEEENNNSEKEVEESDSE